MCMPTWRTGLEDDVLSEKRYPEMFDLAVLSVPGDDLLQASQSRTSLHESLGELSALPIELLNETLRPCDLHSLLIFRRLCHRARHIVDESFPFSVIVSTAPTLVPTLVRTGAALYYSADEVFAALRASSCCICGRFGGLLFLPDCKRCCMRCLRFAAELFPMRLTTAIQLFGLTEAELRRAGVPFIKSLLGTRKLLRFPYYNSVARERVTFVSEPAARQAAERRYGGVEGLRAHIALVKCGSKPDYEQRQARIERARGTEDDLHLAPGFDPSYGRKCRLYAATHLPHIATLYPEPIVEKGHSCQGCHVSFCEAYRRAAPGPERQLLDAIRERLYTEAQLRVHLETCEGAKIVLQIERGERTSGYIDTVCSKSGEKEHAKHGGRSSLCKRRIVKYSAVTRASNA